MPAPRATKARRPAAPPHEVRLIGGAWKRSRLPVADRPGLRPTPARVRETLFNWLGRDLTGWRVLDAFAGSGALGFEAASRGAAEVVLLDADPVTVRSLRASRERLGGHQLRVEQADAMRWMAHAIPARFELVLIDPPFGAGAADAAAVSAAPLLVPGGLLYIESPQPIDLPPPGCEPFRSARAGMVHFGLWRRGYTPGDEVSGPTT